jgi:hypothetical protein
MGRAHAKGVVHRDLKPDNVLFTGDGTPLVADLGLAKHFRREGPAASVSLSRSGELRGTFGYMPIEQMTDSKTVGPPADVFALGAILYECFAGAPAFEGETVAEVASKIGSGELAPLVRARPSVPGWLASVIERALARDAKDRFPDAAAFATALSRPARSSRGVVLLAGAATLAVAVLGAWWIRRAPFVEPAPKPPTPTTHEIARPPVVVAAPKPPGRIKLGAVPRREVAIGWISPQVYYHPRNHSLVLAAEPEYRAALWDLDRKEMVRAFGEPRTVTNKARAFAFSSDGERVAVGLYGVESDRTVRVYETASGRELGPLPAAHGDRTPFSLVSNALGAATVFRVAFLPDGRLLSAGHDGTARAWTVGTGAPFVLGMPEQKQTHGSDVTSLAVSERGVVTTGDDSITLLWEQAGDSWREVDRYASPNHRSNFQCAAVSPDRKLVLLGADSGEVHLWRPGSGAAAIWPSPHRGAVASVAFLPGGAQALTCDRETGLCVWDVKDARVIDRRPGPVVWVDPSGDGSAVLVATGDGRVIELPIEPRP